MLTLVARSAQERHVQRSQETTVVPITTMQMMFANVDVVLHQSDDDQSVVVHQRHEKGIGNIIQFDRLPEDRSAANSLTR